MRGFVDLSLAAASFGLGREAGFGGLQLRFQFVMVGFKVQSFANQRDGTFEFALGDKLFTVFFDLRDPPLAFGQRVLRGLEFVPNLVENLGLSVCLNGLLELGGREVQLVRRDGCTNPIGGLLAPPPHFFVYGIDRLHERLPFGVFGLELENAGKLEPRLVVVLRLDELAGADQ